VTASGPLRIVVQVVAVLRDAVVSFVRDLMIEEFHDGRIRTRGLPAGVRVAVVLSIVTVLALIVSIAVADVWRSMLDPIALSGGQTLRGTLVPEALIPVTFALIAIGAGLCLSGALRASPPVAAGVLLVYLVLAVFVRGNAVLGHGLVHDLAGWAIWAVVAVFVVARFTRPLPSVELAVLLVLVGITFADAHRVLVDSDRTTGTGFLGSQTEVLLVDIVQLSIPVLVVAALDVVDFGVHAARWSLGFVDRRLGQRVVVGGLVLLAAWRIRDLVRKVIDLASEDAGLLARDLVGSVVLLAGIVGGMLLVHRAARRRDLEHPLAPTDPEGVTNSSRRVALPVAIGLLAAALLSAVFFLAAQAVPTVLTGDRAADANRWLVRGIQFSGDVGAAWGWDLARGVLVAGGAALMVRRGRPLGAAFLVCVSAVLAHGALSGNGRVLDDWQWTVSGVDIVLVVVLLAAMVRWALRRELTEARAEWALFLLLLTAMITQIDFLSDPFSPLIAISAVGFVLFGLAWGFATNGSWANDDSGRLPRSSRVQLLIGYQLLSAAILQWFVVTHNLGQIELLASDMPDLGLLWLGYPLIIALVLTGLGAALRDAPIEIGDFDDAAAGDVADDPVEAAPPLVWTGPGRPTPF
jgi:hypothetical protein